MSAATRLFIDAATENVDALPKRLTDLGVQYPKEHEEQFRTELREIYYRYYGASLAEIDPIQVIREAFQLIYTINLHLPTRFLMLDKAIATLASVGAELYPEFNVFEVAKPFARDLMRERFTPDRVARRARKEAVALSQIALELPYQVHDILEEMRDGQIEVGFRHLALDEFMASMQLSFNRLVIALVVAGRVPRLGGARRLRQGRAARARDERDRARRLRPLDDRAVPPPLGRGPFRPFVDRSSQFRAKGHLGGPSSGR